MRNQMKFIAVKWALVFIVSELCHGVTAGKPKMTPAKKEFVIQEGDELKLECQGEGKLYFSTPTKAENINPLKVNNSGTYTFTRSKARKEDTGWYACAEEGVDILNNVKNTDLESNHSARVYVYVNSSEPFVKATSELMPVTAGETVVIPCRPTSPNLTVNLIGHCNQTEKLKYDPKIGFTLTNVSVAISGQGCECTVDGREETAYYQLEVRPPVKFEQTPVIRLDKVNHAVWGRNLTMVCTVRTMAPGWESPDMNWTLPESVPKDRFNFTVGTDEKDNLVWKTILTIHNFEEMYDGNYSCTANAKTDNSEAEPTVIKSLDPKDPFIHATVVMTPNITVNERKNASWMIIIDSYPQDFTWKWYNQNKQAISYEENNVTAKYSHRIDRRKNHFFYVRNVNLTDSGNYTIEFSNIMKKTETDLYLTVLAIPSISFDETVRRTYSPGELATFTCESSGQPFPNITWIIKEYPNVTSDESSKSEFSRNVTNIQGPKGGYHAVSTMIIKVDRNMTLACDSCNELACKESKTFEITVIENPQSNTPWIIAISVLVIIFLVAFCLREIWARVSRKRAERAKYERFLNGDPGFDPEKCIGDQTMRLPYDEKFEFSIDDLNISTEELGRGAFGVVMKAEARGISVEDEVTTVAVKMSQKQHGKESSEEEVEKAIADLIQELKIMIYVEPHPNIVNLLGACTRGMFGKDELLVIVEYCRYGSIHSHLQKNRDCFINDMTPSTGEISIDVGNKVNGYVQHKRYTFSKWDLLHWAWQVSRGMEHLSFKKVLHRDLAARNILLTDNNVVKICDFGLAKNMYKDVNYIGKGKTQLPMRSMAVESIARSLFSTESDVWSFGIVLWELFTLAETPYSEVKDSSQFEELSSKLVKGQRLRKPDYATNEIYTAMRYCWKTNPSDRIKFPELTRTLDAIKNGRRSEYYDDTNYRDGTMDVPYESTVYESDNGQNDHPPVAPEPLNLNVTIDIRGGSSSPQMSCPNIPDFDRASETESFGEEQPDSPEVSSEEFLITTDSGYSRLAKVPPPSNESIPNRNETINIYNGSSPSQIENQKNSHSETAGMLGTEGFQVQRAGSSPHERISRYLSLAKISSLFKSSNQSSGMEEKLYLPNTNHGNIALKPISKQSNYIARPPDVI